MWFYTKLSQNDNFSLNILDSRLRGNDGSFTFIVIPAQAGIQFFKLSLVNKHFNFSHYEQGSCLQKTRHPDAGQLNGSRASKTWRVKGTEDPSLNP